MRNRLLNLILCTALSVVLAGCGNGSRAKIEVPDKLTLYSIDGRYYPTLKKDYSGESLYNCPVLGKVDITSLDSSKELIAALNESIAKSDGRVASCFWPRHAIRSVVKGRTIDYVICFECIQMEINDGNPHKTVPITRDPQELFNRYLTEAGIPLAPASH